MHALALGVGLDRLGAEARRRPVTTGRQRRKNGPVPGRLLLLRTPPVDQLLRNLVEEPRRRVMGGRTPRGPDDSTREIEPLLRAGEADIREPTLLLQLDLVAQR